jgi:hypothetical protein
MDFADIIKKYTNADYSEPSERTILHFKTTFGKLFDNIGYVRENILGFGNILEFMARYQIAAINPERVEKTSPESDFRKIYDAEIAGKKFRKPKGLFLFGHYGTGKTLAARVIADYFNLPLIDTYSISFEYQKKDGSDWIEKWLFSNCLKAVVIDDIGAEGDIRKFGNESPIGGILATRARFWEEYGTPTIYTTNLETPRAVAKAYGNNERLLDRLNAYYVPVEFKGQSLRK